MATSPLTGTNSNVLVLRSQPNPALALVPQQEEIERNALQVLQQLQGFQPAKLHLCRQVNGTYQEHQHILTYIQNSQEHGFQIQVQEIIRVVRQGDYEFQHIPQKRNRFRLMLWHGTKASTVARILSEGFRQPSSSGQMFGTGMYFSDRASKSARYCTTTASQSQPANPTRGSEAYLLLCDVLIGKAYNAMRSRHQLIAPPAGKDSVKCTGKYIPDRNEQVQFAGAYWPIGKTVLNDKFRNYSVNFNEFTVYDPANVRVKYVVKVVFN